MKKAILLLMGVLMASVSKAQLEQGFINPPSEMCSHVILGCDGSITPDVISRDFEEIQRKGFRNIIIEPGYNMDAPYLSDKWFETIRTMADSAAKRGMHLWIIDEGKYPSGMAGGKFSLQQPQLIMQALVEDGDTVRTVRRSSQTRCVNNPTGGKDENHALCDYLDTLAVDQFLEWTHEAYRRTLGSHLGTTVLGFRGDEPAFQRVPWTTDIPEVFKREKGYDLTPWLRSLTKNGRTSLYHASLTEEERAVKADFWDVWSRLFAERYFKRQADWCARHQVSHITHLDKDDDLPWCVKMEGEPFRCLSQVQVPGIDVIWSQIWYDSTTEFPRLASSVAHVYGRQRAFSESFAAYRRPLTVASAKYIVDYQFARGINFFEFMFWMSKQGAKGYMAEEGMKGLNDYVNRVGYVMSQGRPTSKVAIYVPIPMIWLGVDSSYEWMKAVAHLLTSHQYDYDFITDDGLAEAVTPVNGRLVNKSGQAYETIILPAAHTMTSKAWAKIEEMAARGGKIITIGGLPKVQADQSFRNTRPINLPATMLNLTDSTWTSQMESWLPTRELSVIDGNSRLTYCSRQIDGHRAFFVLNQEDRPQTLTLELDCMGDVELWDALSGTIQPLPFKVSGNKTRITLTFDAWESHLIMVRKRTTEYHIQHAKDIQKTINQAHQDGGGTVVLGEGTYETGALFFPRGVDLRLEQGACLKSIVDTTCYPMVKTRLEGIMTYARAALLNFDHNDGCVISGEGLIDGQGLKWNELRLRPYDRPKTICINQCHQGRIQGLHIKNQAFWCLHILLTNGFTVDNIQINAEEYIPSSDGIDIDSSTGIIVRETHIRAHDDCISIKSGKDSDGRNVNKASDNILIEHCHFDYGHGGVALGSEVSGDIRHVTVRNCDMSGENWNPIRIKSQPSRGGTVSDILFENILIEQARNVMEINMTWRMKGATAPPFHPLTKLNNIRLRNVNARATNAGIIHGFEEQPIPSGAITFENCQFETDTPLEIKNADISLKGLEYTRNIQK